MAALFWLGVIFTATAPIVLGVLDHENTSWVAALCGAFITFMARIDSLAELSLGPVKAKMREAISEATATLEQLRDIATTMATASLTHLMSSQFMGGMTARKRFEIHNRIIAELRKIGVPNDKIETAQSGWYNGVGIFFHNRIGRKLREALTAKGTNNVDANKIVMDFNELLDFDNWSVARPADYRKFLTQYDLLDSDRLQWIDDLDHFIKTKEIRRLEELISKE